MLARRLMGRMRSKPAEPVPVGEISHVRIIPPPTGTVPPFLKVAKTGSPTAVNVAPNSVLPTSQFVCASAPHGTITLYGRNGSGGPDEPPHFGNLPSTTAVAALFQSTSLGMVDQPLEVFPHWFAAAGNPEFLLCREFGMRLPVSTSTGSTAFETLNLRTGAAGLISTPNSPLGRSQFVNLGHRLASIPTVSADNFGSSGFQGISFAGNTTQSTGPTGLTAMRLTQEIDDSKDYAYIVPAFDTVSEHWVDLRVEPSADAVMRATRMRTLFRASQRWFAVKGGLHYTVIETRTTEVIRTAMGPAQDLDQGGTHIYTVYPCTVRVRSIRRIGLGRFAGDGSFVFVPWLDQRFDETSSALFYGGERRVKSTGVPLTPSTARWYYRPGPASWPSAMPLTTVLDLPRPTSGILRAMPDRLIVAVSGVVRSWSYDGVWLGDGTLPAGTNGIPIAGEDVIVAGAQYSRDYGLTWSSVAAGVADGTTLQTVRKF